MPSAEYVSVCECCGEEHREAMTEIDPGAGGPVFVHRDEAHAFGWRQVSNGNRLVDLCPACVEEECWRYIQ